MALSIFDMDGTLISSSMEAPNRRYGDWHVLPGRPEVLASLREEGHHVAIATNRAGVALGHLTESQVARKIAAVLAALGLPTDPSTLLSSLKGKWTILEIPARSS